MELSLAVIASSNRRKTRRKKLINKSQRINLEDKSTSLFSLRSAMVSASGIPVLIFYTSFLKVQHDLINCTAKKASPVLIFNALMELQLRFSANVYRKSHIAVWSTGGEDSSGPPRVTLVNQSECALPLQVPKNLLTLLTVKI